MANRSQSVAQLQGGLGARQAHQGEAGHRHGEVAQPIHEAQAEVDHSEQKNNTAAHGYWQESQVDA